MELNRGILIQLKRVALSLAAMAALSWVVQVCQVPNPNMILITGLTVFIRVSAKNKPAQMQLCERVHAR